MHLGNHTAGPMTLGNVPPPDWTDPQLAEAIEDCLSWCAEQLTHAATAKALTANMQLLQNAIAEMATARRSAVQQWRAENASLVEIATVLDVSRTTVIRILQD